MSKIKFTIDTQDADGIAKAVKMLQAINGPTTVSATVTEETETEEAAEEQQPEKKERKPRQPRKPVEETKTEDEEVETEESAEEQPKKETKKTESSVTLDGLRTLLSEKVTDHRELIKNKLKELGAASVSTLSEDKYEEFFNFLDFL